jgi:mono/diheme cytochrome c family protein
MKTLLSRVFLFVLVVIAPAFLSTWTIREDGKLKAQDPSAGQREINFAREVQPLLARRCFACHGPDKAEGGLRLHESDKAFAKLESGELAIVPGKPSESSLLKRISSSEEDFRMPPEGKPLSETEQALLRSWIEQGAKWERHWAFEPIGTPEIPAAVDSKPGSKSVASAHPIDRFIDQKLAAVGLARNGRAEATALLRRLSFDLTGLPPTAAQIEEFKKAAEIDFEKAYEEQVDKLLASERYGEKWARHWLDVVRFAETNSFERDGRKPHAWRYRDYVIRSFNSGKPYDQFLREQLAGDELPEVTRDSLIATGFYRLGIWDDEPADRELAMYDGFDDIITTVGQGLLGLTMNCSRCHDHKIDPIPTHDYYSMLAFFRNVTPNGNGPQVERPLLANAEDREQFRLAESHSREKVNQLQAELTKLEQQLRSQMQDGEKEANRGYDLDDLEYRFYRDEFRELPNFDELKPETVAKLNPPLIDIKPATRPDNFGFVFTGTLIVPEDGEYTFIMDSDDGSRLSIDGKMVIDHDGIHGEGRPKRTVLRLTQGRVPLRLDYFQGLFGKGLQLSWSGPSFKRRSLTAGEAFSRQDFNQALNNAEAAGLDANMVADYRRVAKELDEAKRIKPWEEYGMCVSESGTAAPETFVLTRGSPQGKADKVEPSFLSIFGSVKPEIVPNEKSNTSGRRLAFADWVTSSDNRLTSRVIANRVWQHLFGRGIVRSPNNFGQLGDIPTHPELLDWLARELMSKGWKLKELQKMMVMSETYRQSSIPSPEAQQKDPNNDWFSHFNMRRLSAEEIRDSILATNGRLNLEMYGPGVFPEISREVLAGQSVPGSGWDKSSYEQQARRSVYIHVKRSLVVPFLSAFDFPDTDTSCEARFITVQPGQALSMLNGDYLNEQSAELAKRVRREGGNDLRSQVEAAIVNALTRKAEEKEIERGLQLIQKLKEKHGLNDDQALDNFCLFLYNLNEFIYLD